MDLNLTLEDIDKILDLVPVYKFLEPIESYERKWYFIKENTHRIPTLEEIRCAIKFRLGSHYCKAFSYSEPTTNGVWYFDCRYTDVGNFVITYRLCKNFKIKVIVKWDV